MARYAALLRGINVGGRNKVAMADLRTLVTALGHEDVATYVQSGNVVFSGSRAAVAELADALERELAAQLDLQAAVVVLTAGTLAQVIEQNPYPDEDDPKHLHVAFTQDPLDVEAVAGVADAQERAAQKGSPDAATVVDGVLYLRTPDGLGRSELGAQLNRKGGVAREATLRNWTTVTKLMALLEELPPG